MHNDTIAIMNHYTVKSGSFNVNEYDMATALAEARDILRQIARAREAKQANELAATYLEVHKIK